MLLPIRKDSLVSKLPTSNIQMLTSHNAKPLTAMSLPTGAVDSKTVSKVESKEEGINHKTAISKHNV